MVPPNPYRAPRAPVDAPVAVDRRPPRVNRALALLWASLAVGGISVGASLQEVAESEFYAVVAIVTVLLFAANATLIWLIGRRHNWARILNLFLVVIALAVVSYGDAHDDVAGIVAAVAEWTSTALELVAMYLLFSGESASWFRSGAQGAATAG